ncbi:unnamed protein product, partial [Ectocarpus sp. 4 AP-2014]
LFREPRPSASAASPPFEPAHRYPQRPKAPGRGPKHHAHHPLRSHNRHPSNSSLPHPPHPRRPHPFHPPCHRLPRRRHQSQGVFRHQVVPGPPSPTPRQVATHSLQYHCYQQKEKAVRGGEPIRARVTLPFVAHKQTYAMVFHILTSPWGMPRRGGSQHPTWLAPERLVPSHKMMRPPSER